MATGRRPGRRREEILDTALEVFADGGFHGTSLAVVAHRCGLSQKGLLHYFPTTQALLPAVLARRDELDADRFSRDGRPETVLSEAAALARHDQSVPGLVKAYSVLAAESTTEGHPATDHVRRRFAEVPSRFAADLAAEYGETLPPGVRAGRRGADRRGHGRPAAAVAARARRDRHARPGRRLHPGARSTGGAAGTGRVTVRPRPSRCRPAARRR